MKKLIICFCFVNIYLFSNAQSLNPYVQLESGLAFGHKNTGVIYAEVGMSYKWLDIALATDYVSNSFAKEYIGEINIFKDEGYDPERTHNDSFSYFTNTSLQVIAKIDVIRLMRANSKHSIKLGVGYGLIRYQKSWSMYDFNNNSELAYNLTTKSYLGMLGSVKVSYEYKLKPKLIVGTYLGGTLYPSIGLLLRSNF